MTRFLEREKARSLRAEGKSYSEIKAVLGISKGTLSEWLKDMPLRPEQIRQLRDLNPRRIERYRETRRKQREARLDVVYKKAKHDIGRLSERELFIAGLVLYWAEGTKSAYGRVEVANTDPAMIATFHAWLIKKGVPANKIRVRLQLYADMNIEDEVRYWSKLLGIPKRQFRQPRIKDSALTGLTRKHGHGHGTCDLIFDNVPLWEYITMALKRLRELQIRP